VAASLGALPLLPRLVFLVVGPAVDVKLVALQAGTFGRGFAARFAPTTLLVAVGCGTAAGMLALGGARCAGTPRTWCWCCSAGPW
jgi:uncharacterized membrane protein YraQ (UPF0718 family)